MILEEAAQQSEAARPHRVLSGVDMVRLLEPLAKL